MSGTNIIPFGQQGRVPAAFAGTDWRKANDAAAGGITGGFSVLSIRGKAFHVKQRGVETTILNREGDAVQSLPVVVLAANSAISKIYYEKGFDEGANAPPDCFSVDGITPDPAAAKKQSEKCATCKQNVWGSKTTPAGVKIQACSNSKRLAVVPALRVDENNPYDDASAEAVLRNEVYGGPLLLRLPGSALADWAKFMSLCSQFNVPFYGAVARLRFETSVAYPKPIFEGLRQLTDHESWVVKSMQELPVTTRIINEITEAATDTSAPITPVVPTGLAPAPAPVTQAPVTAPAPAPVPAPVQAAPAPAPTEDPIVKLRAELAAMEAAAAATPVPVPTPDPAPAPAVQTIPEPVLVPASTLGQTSPEMDSFLADTERLAT